MGSVTVLVEHLTNSVTAVVCVVAESLRQSIHAVSIFWFPIPALLFSPSLPPPSFSIARPTAVFSSPTPVQSPRTSSCCYSPTRPRRSLRTKVCPLLRAASPVRPALPSAPPLSPARCLPASPPAHPTPHPRPSAVPPAHSAATTFNQQDAPGAS
ncbi:hypothetical protein P691DRAFT_357446 [Macrolepiota fuliginosa MF-IS2]|uniref:Uncharacterized protein n=1 Tax=Macrolepiota fuliginosa MF-IS2 TaxID=1400762 RepID=A0A9P5X6D0_9AGAR|nr:hypothetical protein P691DRAFT_357446 [Macrolepiota fuliginosa MF-IS2]